MQTFERTNTLDDKQARYYDLSALGNKDKNKSRTAAHFYGGNGFTTGVYLPLLTKLSAHFAITSLAMRGYWHDLPSVKKLTHEQDADILIDFLERHKTALSSVLDILKVLPPLPSPQPNVQSCSQSFIW